MKFYSHRLIFSLFLVSLVSVGQDLIPFENRGTGLWGFRNQETGDVVIEPKFDEVEEFAHGQVWVKNSHGSFLIDKKGKILVSLIFDDVSVSGFSEGLCGVKKDGKWGLIDKTGKEVIPLIYDWVGEFSEGLCGVFKGDFETGKMGIYQQTRSFSLSPT